jgi:hypothetical protein
MKIVVMNQPAPGLLQEVKDDPALFGNVWMDEPIDKLGSVEMDRLFGDFLAYREAVHKVAPALPVFIRIPRQRRPCNWLPRQLLSVRPNSNSMYRRSAARKKT